MKTDQSPIPPTVLDEPTNDTPEPTEAPAEREVFGRNLRLARLAARLSQSQLGLSQGFVSQIENGQKRLTLDSMAALARKVGVPLWKLLVP